MKKRTPIIMITILILTLLLLSAGCASKEAPSASASPSPSGVSPSVKPTVSQSADPSPTPSLIIDPPPPSSEPSAVPSAKPSPSPKDNGKDYAALGWALMESESLGSLKLRLSESELIALMGEPDSKSETEVWGADGLEHSNWSYASKGLDIGMAQQPDDTEAFIFSLTAVDPCELATSRGIKLGDSKDAVLGAYKNEIDPSANDDTDSWIIVGSVYGGMGIGIENGVVTYLFIGSSAE